MQDEDLEVLDLVNAQDEVVGTIHRSEMVKAQYKQAGVYVRFVNAFVVSKAGLLLVPTRSLKKKVAPGGMDYSAAEHVLSGESYDDAMVRGFNEEIGLQVNPSMFTLLGVLPPTATKPFFDAVYVLLDYAGKDPVLNRDEFVSSEWLTIDEIKRRITTATTPQKVSLLPALELLTRKIG